MLIRSRSDRDFLRLSLKECMVLAGDAGLKWGFGRKCLASYLMEYSKLNVMRYDGLLRV